MITPETMMETLNGHIEQLLNDEAVKRGFDDYLAWRWNDDDGSFSDFQADAMEEMPEGWSAELIEESANEPHDGIETYMVTAPDGSVGRLRFWGIGSEPMHDYFCSGGYGWES